MSLKALLASENKNLTKMESLEGQALSFTARKLSLLIKERFDKRTTITKTATLSFAQVFTDSMVIAWLYGQHHLLESIKSEIKLADDDVTVQFSEAIEHLKSLVPMEGDEYQKLEANLKLRAFTIASVIGEEGVNRVKRYYIDALSLGQSKSEAMQGIDGWLEKAGISESNPYWLDLHYRNNMMTAYNVGRWTQVEHNAAVDYLMYSAVRDNGTTELCKHLDKTVKRKSDPFWRKYYPPNHHKCRSIMMAISKEMYDRLPQNDKNRSERLSESALKANPVFEKEHQFKNSPTAALERLPAGLVSKAVEYDLVKRINEQTFKQNSKRIQQAVDKAKAVVISQSLINRATKDTTISQKSKDKIKATTATATEAHYGLYIMANGEAQAVTYMITWLDTQTASVAKVAAFGGDVMSVAIMSKDEVAELLALFVSLK
ncbi:phage minor head protein [Photobacterium piscicola]|uniref:phage head morphogenesis protein n=1 Tax=Photobacterium piscicola TaxID=1378299 RepID=UPI003734DDE9